MVLEVATGEKNKKLLKTMTMKVNHLSFPDVSTGKIWVIITNPFSQTRHVFTRKRILKVKIFSTESFSTCMKYTAIDMN